MAQELKAMVDDRNANDAMDAKIAKDKAAKDKVDAPDPQLAEAKPKAKQRRHKYMAVR